MVSFGNLPNGLGPSPGFGSAKVTDNVTLMQAHGVNAFESFLLLPYSPAYI
jgi:hypothetical protein